MIEQIKYVDGSLQDTIFKHDQLFNHMRHGVKGRQQHKNCDSDQNGIGNLVQKMPHENFRVKPPGQSGD